MFLKHTNEPANVWTNENTDGQTDAVSDGETGATQNKGVKRFTTRKCELHCGFTDNTPTLNSKKKR